MDVIPVVAQETASRYHKQAGERSMSSAVTRDVAALLTRLWLLCDRDSRDGAGDVASTVPVIEQRVDDMVDYLLHRCSLPSLSTLSLQARCDNLRTTNAEQAHQASVKKEAIAVQVEDALLSMEPGLVTVEQVWAALAVCIIHHYGSGSSLVPSSAASATATTTATATAAAAAAMPSSSSDPAFGEAISAVSAALPRAQVAGFLQQDRVERAGQLRQLRRIAWGLRLYQKETGRSTGVDMAPLPTTVDAPLTALEAKCEAALTSLDARIARTRALLTSPTCALAKAALSVLREEYHHLLLMLHMLKCAQCGLRQLRDCVSVKVLGVYQATLSELRELLSSARKTPPAAGAIATGNSTSSGGAEAAPKKIVFPKFMELADAYELGMKCADQYNYYGSLLQIVAGSAEGYASTLPTNAAEDALARQQAKAEAATASTTVKATTLAALAAEVGAVLDSDTTRQRLPVGVRVCYCAELPLHTVDAVVGQLYPQSLCAMRGCCPVHYLEGRPMAGLMLPGQVSKQAATSSNGVTVAAAAAAAALSGGPGHGDVGLGCIEVSGGTGACALPRPLYFVFADAAAMRAFAADPWRYVDGCLRVFHAEEPTVSLVMGLADELPHELYLEGARTVERVTSIESNTQTSLNKVDCGTQTGQIDPYVDHHYFWNEWDLRRHALKLANLMHMRTHSTQTTASHFRREATTQVNPPKDSETQTLQDAATQPPRVVQYLKGLRGTATSAIEQVQHVVEH